MNKFVPALLCLVFLFLAAGCASTHTVVILMPDPDGHVGKAAVHTNGGTQLLDASHGMTTVSRRSSPPTAVTSASAAYLATTFAEVMAMEPAPAEKFMLFFHTGTTDLVSESEALLPTILATIKRRGAVSVSVSGHTDAAGPVQLNETLARNRALAIKKLLVQEGSDPERLIVTSHGKGNPLVPTADGVAEPRNRRVEIIVR
jgi:outer membrane protein OmpA-like peptidoglycan-associated protein